MTTIKKENKTKLATDERKKKMKEEYLEAFSSSACNVSVSCRKIGISRNTFYVWRKEDEAFNEKVIEEEESLLDFAETMLYKGIRQGKTAELIFYLKTKGKFRGYIERIETDEINDREPIEVRIVRPNLIEE